MKKKVVGLIEEVELISGRKKKKVYAKFDTGAYRSSIDYDLVKELGLKPLDKTVKTKSSSLLGKFQERKLVNIKFRFDGKIYETTANISHRHHSNYKLLLGREIIFGNFIIDITKSNFSPKEGDIKDDYFGRFSSKSQI